jgi:hypothetical protein
MGLRKEERKISDRAQISCNEIGHIIRRVRKIALATISFLVSVCTSVRLHGTNPTGRILMNFDIYASFENLSRKFKFH